MLQRALIVLGHDAPAVHDEDGECLGQWPVGVEDLVEQRGQVDAGGQLALGPVLGGPVHTGGLPRQRDQVAHTEERKANSAALVSAGFSCCTQWPAPSITVAPRKSGITSAMASMAPGIMVLTGSSEPVMKATGMV